MKEHCNYWFNGMSQIRKSGTAHNCFVNFLSILSILQHMKQAALIRLANGICFFSTLITALISKQNFFTCPSFILNSYSLHIWPPTTAMGKSFQRNGIQSLATETRTEIISEKSFHLGSPCQQERPLASGRTSKLTVRLTRQH